MAPPAATTEPPSARLSARKVPSSSVMRPPNDDNAPPKLPICPPLAAFPKSLEALAQNVAPDHICIAAPPLAAKNAPCAGICAGELAMRAGLSTLRKTRFVLATQRSKLLFSTLTSPSEYRADPPPRVSTTRMRSKSSFPPRSTLSCHGPMTNCVPSAPSSVRDAPSKTTISPAKTIEPISAGRRTTTDGEGALEYAPIRHKRAHATCTADAPSTNVIVVC